LWSPRNTQRYAPGDLVVTLATLRRNVENIAILTTTTPQLCLIQLYSLGLGAPCVKTAQSPSKHHSAHFACHAMAQHSMSTQQPH
jgi:hypothetical protein